MMETQRLREAGAAAERALLESARGDGPGPGAAQRMLGALQGLPAGDGDGALDGPADATAPAGSSAAGPAAPHALTAGGLLKVGLVGLVGLGVLGGGVLVHRLIERPSLPVPAAPVPAPAVREARARGIAAVSATEPSSAAAAAMSAPAPAGLGHGEPNPDRSLGAEIRILDVVRAALDARQPAAAQRALDGYEQRFPRGSLRPEATVLRLAVLIQQGRRATARSLAAQLLAGETYKAYEPRIRSLLREAAANPRD